QVALITDRKANNGLPSNVSGAEGERAPINHGFKALQIAISAWTAEALKLTMPASVFSRSTECHNQDKVSMGTIAARDGLRVLELTEQVAAATLLIMQQGLMIRLRRGEITRADLQPQLVAFLDDVSQSFAFLDEDRPLEGDLHAILANIHSRHWAF
ncbi:MAG: aromatic amino acid lyase, partial [Verrucomicrobia bacterium]|nr:aromatic amino acid lyase [Verrucomicrobiota bacterium]